MKTIKLSDCRTGDILYSNVVCDDSVIALEGQILDPPNIEQLEEYTDKVCICTSQQEVRRVVRTRSIYLPNLEETVLNTSNYIVGSLLKKPLVQYFYNNKDIHMGNEVRHHQVNVAMLTSMFLCATKINVMGKTKEIVEGALLHDVGKLDLPRSIIDTGRGLTLDERQIVQFHPAIGYEALTYKKASTIITNIARYHHEWSDGSGYPHGLLESEIPWEAQLVHIVDVYEAMCAERNYKPTKERQEARYEMLMEKQKYNKELLDEFFEVIPEYFPGDTIKYDHAFYRVIGYTESRDPVLRQVIGIPKDILLSEFDRNKVEAGWFTLSAKHILCS